MNRLNFSPCYERYLISGAKTTTIRLNNKHGLSVGDQVALNVGWRSSDGREVGRATIKQIYRKPVKDLDDSDLEGESPDCRSAESARLVLSGIYRRVVRDTDPVFIIKFERLLSGTDCFE